MKSSTITSVKTLFVGASAFLAISTVVPSFHFVQTARAAEGAEDERTEEVDARRKMDEIVRMNESTQGRARAAEIATRLKMSADDFVAFFESEAKAGKRSPQTDVAWAKLLTSAHVPMRSDVTEADFQSADIASESVGAFMHMKKTGAADNLRISAQDLATIQTKWTLEERTNFSKVLRRTAEIASKGETATLEDAYQKALDELGFREKANKYCRK